MAGFKTHITTSSLLGIAYGAGAYFQYDVPLSTCVLAGGLCSVSGMLPDLDSDSGVPLRESIAFAAAVVPMLMIDRFQQFGWSNESIVLAGGLIYLVIRFGFSRLFKGYTVHRGMWHSLPAAIIAGLLAFLIMCDAQLELRLYKTGAVVIGFMSHLVLDEMYSLQWQGGRWRVKRSFGTALKLWSRRSLWANVSTYGKLVLLVALAVGDPLLMEYFGYEDQQVPRTARNVLHDVLDQRDDVLSRGAKVLR